MLFRSDAVRAVVLGAPPAAVVIDLALAVLDGWYVLADLGARPHRPLLVAIAETDDSRGAARATMLGADAVTLSAADALRAVAGRVGALAR